MLHYGVDGRMNSGFAGLAPDFLIASANSTGENRDWYDKASPVAD